MSNLSFGSLLFALAFLSACNSMPSSTISWAPSGNAKGLSETIQCGATFQITDAHRQGCQSDQDCQIIAADCCGCNAGGVQSAVVSSKSAEVLSCKTLQCAEIMCAQMISQDQSCQKTAAVCRLGSCELQ